MRGYYLLGTCYKSLAEWSDAIESFRQAVRRYEKEQDIKSMVSLSFLGLSETLLRESQYESALTTLEVLLKNYSDALDSDYPRYPFFEDGYVLDDAQFLSGICKLLLEQSKAGVAAILQTLRFYPGLTYGQSAQDLADTLILLLEREDWIGLENVVLRLLEQYLQEHGWPLE